jgi:hypothetical protein
MAQYKITARRINDQPDANGWRSMGHDLPTFWVEGVGAENAARIGHDVAGHGVKDLTRTIVQAYRETEDGREEYTDTTQWWADGRMVDPTRVNRQYARDELVIAGQMYAEDDADTATWFTHDACVWLALSRTKRGKWAIESSDFVIFRASDYRRRFAKADDALRWVECRARVVVLEVDKW